MTGALAFFVNGEPVAKGRARSRVVTPRVGKAFASHYTPPTTRAYEAMVRLRAQSAAALVRWTWSDKDRFALRVIVYREHEGRGGDLDNYVKAIGDALNGVAFPDDRRVRELRVTLRRDPERPRVYVEVRKISETNQEASHGE